MKTLLGILIVIVLECASLSAAPISPLSGKYLVTNRCQSGTVCMGYCLSPANCIGRDVVQAVLFPLPYAHKPNILITGLNYIDIAGQDRGTRLNILKEAITPFGFNARFISWHAL
ncbi:unnamed protein product [Rotaria socialis]|uniref:Uncharacterized protein n=1 Tax=Rotaria socialis TaxID=392032 RepID=A0A817X1Y0_9BILA|nr:unnamed protein product [Rotaria socialis]CAF3363691.1 unnamed protein product [Rotaria socialis]CAF4426852.1 unnamed protein product [Rotaria socialis]CAF4686152.1 unnamed protein product [Rotaria socialis]